MAGLAVLSSLLGVGTSSSEEAVVADLQVVALEGDRFVVRLRASRPLAFDVLAPPGPARVIVRLHGARLRQTAIEVTPFATVTLAEDGDGLFLGLDLVDPGYRTRVIQGDNPGVVEVHVTR
jgi:hypothetical protein